LIGALPSFDDGSGITDIDGMRQPVLRSEFAYLDFEGLEMLRGLQGTLSYATAEPDRLRAVADSISFA
jgi:hypothetical protein